MSGITTYRLSFRRHDGSEFYAPKTFFREGVAWDCAEDFACKADSGLAELSGLESMTLDQCEDGESVRIWAW